VITEIQMAEAISRDEFSRNLERATAATREATLKYCSNELPSGVSYFVRLNCSFDGNPLEEGEYFFPDHDLPNGGDAQSRKHDEVIELLWRGGKIPEWINILPFDVDSKVMYYQLECCGRFTDEPRHLYHTREGCPPFHSQLSLPNLDFDLENDGKFDLRSYKLSNE
jgi:hypothetical protein